MGLILRSMVSSPKKQAPRISLLFIENLLSFPEVSLFERRTISQTRQGNTSRLHGSDFFPSRKITYHCMATNTYGNLCNIMTVDIYRNTLQRRTLSILQRSHALHLNDIPLYSSSDMNIDSCEEGLALREHANDMSFLAGLSLKPLTM